MSLAKATIDPLRNEDETSRPRPKANRPAPPAIMDARAFDQALDLRDLAYEREMRTLRGIQQGIDEAHAGLLRPYSDIRAELDL